MVPELEKPRITEIQVRIDCNGCVQKIKKALNCINGIYEIYIDLPKQKITVIGWADPEKIIKAIKKTRRTATICSHSELPQQSIQSSEGPPPEGGGPPPEEGGPPPEGGGPQPEGGGPPPEGGGPPPEGGGPLPQGGGPPPQGGGPPPEGRGTPPPPPPPQDARNHPQPEPEPPKDQQQHGPPPPPAESQAPETVTQPTGPETSSSQPPPQYPSRPYKDVGEVHVHPIHHYSSHHHPVDYRLHYHQPDYHPPDYSYRYDYGHYRYNPAYSQGGPQGYGGYGPAANYSYRQERPEPVHVSHSYSTHRPSPYVTQYHEYVPSPPHYTSSTPNYAQMDHQQYHYAYGDYYRDGSSNNNGSVSSVFSDENPNACTIV